MYFSNLLYNKVDDIWFLQTILRNYFYLNQTLGFSSIYLKLRIYIQINLGFIFNQSVPLVSCLLGLSFLYFILKFISLLKKILFCIFLFILKTTQGRIFTMQFRSYHDLYICIFVNDRFICRVVDFAIYKSNDCYVNHLKHQNRVKVSDSLSFEFVCV